MPGPSGVQRVLDSRVNWSEFHDRLTEYESQLENENDFVQNKKKQLKKKCKKYKSMDEASRKYFEKKIKYMDMLMPFKYTIYEEKAKTLKLLRKSLQNGQEEPTINAYDLDISSASDSSNISTDAE